MDSHQNKNQSYGWFTHYRYIEGIFKLLLIVGIANAVIAGFAFQGGVFVFVKTFSEYKRGKPTADIRDDIEWLAWIVLMIAGVQTLCCTIFVTCFHLVGQKVVFEIRWRYLKALLTKDSEWYEARNIEEIPSIIYTNLIDIENGSGKTFGFLIYSYASFLAGVMYGFLLGAVFAACYLFSPVLVMMIGGFNDFSIKKANEQDEKNFIKSGSTLEQSLHAIKIVKAFGQENCEIERYERHLICDKTTKKLYTFMYSISCGFFEVIFYIGCVLSYIVGTAFVVDEVNNGNFDRPYSMGDIFGIYICIQYGSYLLGNSMPNLQIFQLGLKAIQSVMEVIDHIPQINVDDDTLAHIDSIESVEYKNVSFQYKSREKPAITNIDLRILKGKTTAFVGESGSGKSTVVKLLSRLYDPCDGEILVNGQDLKSINLRQYRRRISYVSQEPSLFNESIKENLLNGNPNASDAEIEQALKVCMAFDFIQKLPDGINTNFGEIGGILSGGQKQRIALARAVLRKPDLLILDEATSALDTRNEKKVQDAIENVSKEYKMTTVVIAHRLNTIKNADKIYVLDRGQVIEEGSHEELIRSNKTYAEYYKSQQSAMAILRNLKEKGEVNNVDQESISEDKMTEEDNQIKELVSKENLEAKREMTLYETSTNLLTFSKPIYYIIIVFFGAIFVGVSMACAAIPATKGIFKVLGKDTKHEKWEASWHSIIVLSGQIASVIVVQTLTKYFLRRIADKLSINLRSQTFRTLVKQPIQFFDSKSNSIGSLVGMLSADIRHINGATVEIYLLVLQGVAGAIGAITIALIYSWRIGLMILPVIPMFSIGFAVQFNLQFTPPNKTKTSSKRQFSMVSDCIMNYQTIASLAYEDEYLLKYKIKPNEEVRAGVFNTEDINILNALAIGFTYGASQSTILVLYAVGSLSLAERIDSGESPTNSFTAVNTSYFGGFVLCNALMNGPNFSKGKAVAAKILKVISSPKEGAETSPIIDGEESMTKEFASQEIKFTDVWFKYPLENSRWVLKNFNLSIKPGQCVGLIGESGSGKSTIVQLLLRFYDPQEGNITIGGVNIKHFTINSLRSMLGLVQQEPILFNTSVMENIIYGKPDANSDEIKKATEMANAHHFVCNLDSNEHKELDQNIEIREDQRYDSLEPGYKASCGSKGSKLSGGQKQRIAIARALVRDPPILLLDEATSALDEKSQQEVQQALDGIVGKKTCIVIAHRTSTLKNCHKVYEISEGTIMN